MRKRLVKQARLPLSLTWSRSLLIAASLISAMVAAPAATTAADRRVVIHQTGADPVEAPDLSGEYEGRGAFSMYPYRELSAADAWSYKAPPSLLDEPSARIKLRLQLDGTEYSGSLEVTDAVGRILSTTEFTTRVINARNPPPSRLGIYLEFLTEVRNVDDPGVPFAATLTYRYRHQEADPERLSLDYRYVRDGKGYSVTGELPINTRAAATADTGGSPLSPSSGNQDSGAVGLIAAGLAAIAAVAALAAYFGRTPASPPPQADISPDGWPSGTTTEHDPEGAINKRMPDGTVATRYTDGTVHTTYPDGEAITEYPDGTVKTWTQNGTTITELPNGTTEIINPDLTTATITADKVVGTLIDKNGLRYTVSDNAVSIHGEVEAADGNTLTINGDLNGVTLSWKDGSTAELDANGEMTKAHLIAPDGITVDITQDSATGEGALQVKDDKGNSARFRSDGSAEFADQDGLKMSVQADGTCSATTPGGDKWTARPDGTGVIEGANGSKAILDKDGGWTLVDAVGQSTTYTPQQIQTMADNRGLGGHGMAGLNKQVQQA